MIEFSFDDAQVKRLKDRFKRIPGGMQAAFTDFAMEVTNRLQSEVANKTLKVRTGRLLGSIQSALSGDQRSWQAIIGSGARNGKRVVYANILETGGTIRPKNRKFLTIPTEYAKTAAGASKGFTAAQVFDGLVAPYKTGVVLDGMIYGVIAQATRTKLVPLFILKKSVKIRPFGYMAKTVAGLRPSMPTLLNRIGNSVLERFNA